MDICAAVEKRFIATLGLNIATFGRTGLERIIGAARKRSGVEDEGAYLELLSTSPEEFDHLLEELVVPETWFFRDQEPFRLLKQHLLSDWLPSRPGRVVRILSAPCSTGEEPYSIAMTLLEAGIQPSRFQLDATDISRRALAAAGRTRYGKGAFRQPLTAAQEAFFTGPAGERSVDELPARAVHFFRANLVDPHFLAGQAPYHIIFCRNVLIYLTDAARRVVLANIVRLLAPDGILFTGHAEMGILLKEGFTAVRHARSFACRRTAPERRPDGTIGC
jgi:chemotaxis protein methyltransferase WspC